MLDARGTSVNSGRSVKLGRFVVTEFKLASGEVMPLVVGRETRVPHTCALRYVIVTQRTPGASSNTIRNVCQGIALGLSYLEEQGIDLMERLASRVFGSTQQRPDSQAIEDGTKARSRERNPEQRRVSRFS